MSTGPVVAEGSASGPARSHVLDRLAAERRQAAGCFEWGRVAELDQQIAVLSRGNATSPAHETTGRRPAAATRRKR